MMLLEFAKFYKEKNLNIVPIFSILNSNSLEDPLKSPSIKFWKRYIFKRNSDLNLDLFKTFHNYGVGLILGYDNIRAIDVDGNYDIKFIEEILVCLRLPKNYPWVVKTGSHKGFHIIFRCETHEFPVAWNRVKVFTSNGFYKFERLELRWNGHLVLPPSPHKSGKKYEFIFGNFPKENISTIEAQAITTLYTKFCDDSLLTGSSGIFLDYGLSKLSNELTIINEDLSRINNGKLNMIFFFKFLKLEEVDQFQVRYSNNILYQGTWIIYDEEYKIIEFCNYLVKPYDKNLSKIFQYQLASIDANIAVTYPSEEPHLEGSWNMG